jgi:hypothetical protein
VPPEALLALPPTSGGELLKYEFGKASALIGCMAPEPGASKLFCAVGLVVLAEDTGSVLDGSIAKVDISERAKNLQPQIANLQKQFDGLAAK